MTTPVSRPATSRPATVASSATPSESHDQVEARDHAEAREQAKRLTDLEMRITLQDDLVEQLNAVIYEQQKQIDAILKKVSALEKQSDDPTAPRNEKPPHY